MDVGVVIVLVLLLAFFVLGGIATVRTVRAVKRGVERTGAQVRRTVEETTLKARSAQPGPVGEAARIRLELRSSIDGTRAAPWKRAPPPIRASPRRSACSTSSTSTPAGSTANCGC
ncbi:hypothetical protein ACWV95_13180 [Streptomyces albus]